MPAQDRTRITRVLAVALLLIVGPCSGVLSHAAAQPYKDRRVVEVLRDFQRQGVRVVFSTGLVTPDMRVGVEPHGTKPEEVIAAILAPHDLALRVGLRGILLVVPAASLDLDRLFARKAHGLRSEFPNHGSSRRIVLDA